MRYLLWTQGAPAQKIFSVEQALGRRGVVPFVRTVPPIERLRVRTGRRLPVGLVRRVSHVYLARLHDLLVTFVVVQLGHRIIFHDHGSTAALETATIRTCCACVGRRSWAACKLARSFHVCHHASVVVLVGREGTGGRGRFD